MKQAVNVKDAGQPDNRELLNYQLQELRSLITQNHKETQRHLDKKDAEQVALLLRIDTLESWRDMRIGELKREKEQRDHQARFSWGLLGSTIMLFIHALWSTFRVGH